ncbi:hypothetical protein C2W64_03486 [Brevibacillus laterosporus]|nr:hypothetical protein C2W64_03486 [Brevibacillus laterosporus]
MICNRFSPVVVGSEISCDGEHVFRNATIFFYLANEVLSIIENAGRIGLPVPEVIKKAVDVLKEKGGAK